MAKSVFSFKLFMRGVDLYHGIFTIVSKVCSILNEEVSEKCNFRLSECLLFEWCGKLSSIIDSTGRMFCSYICLSY
jgi:hypothetical protein